MADFNDLLETLKRAAAALREAEVPFLLGGGLAAWARGGPETEHDLDLMVKPEDAEHALKALDEAGFRIEKPPEDWLYKAWNGVLEIARALREQIDWDDVWRRTCHSPYVRGFFYLAEQLGILGQRRAGPGETDSSRVPSASARGA